jgi:hypothetical protein
LVVPVGVLSFNSGVGKDDGEPFERIDVLSGERYVGPRANRHALLKPGNFSIKDGGWDIGSMVNDKGEVRRALRRLFKASGMNTESYVSAAEEFLGALSGHS